MKFIYIIPLIFLICVGVVHAAPLSFINTDFECGTMAGWTQYASGGSISSVNNTGSYSMRIDGAGDGVVQGLAYQSMPTGFAQGNYTLRAYFKITNTTSSSIGVVDIRNDTSSTTCGSVFASGNQDWTLVTARFYISDNGTGQYLRIWGVGNVGSHMYIDDITIYPDVVLSLDTTPATHVVPANTTRFNNLITGINRQSTGMIQDSIVGTYADTIGLEYMFIFIYFSIMLFLLVNQGGKWVIPLTLTLTLGSLYVGFLDPSFQKVAYAGALLAAGGCMYSLIRSRT
jgi:hypothetical protein